MMMRSQRYLCVCLGLFLSMIDTSIVATSLYSIGTEFGNVADANWVALAYTLAYMGCAVVFSRISDVIGRRDGFVAAYVLFVAFSLACGWSKNMRQLVAFRALQGTGGSGLYSLTMIMLPEMSPVHLRQHIGAMVGFVVAMAGVLGPVLGGLLTSYTSWRWVFWVNGPVGAASLAIFILGWPKEEHRPVLHKHSWKGLDYPGAFLTMAAAVLVVFSFQSAGNVPGAEKNTPQAQDAQGNDWTSVVFVAPLVLGVVCWIALFSWQYLIERRRYSSRFSPILPIRLFRRGIYTSCVLNTLLLGFPYMLLIFVVPLRVQVVGGKSALLAGVMLLPMLVMVAIGSVVSGAVNSKKPMIAESLLVGSCLMLLGCGLLTTLSTREPDSAKLLGFVTFCGLGFGLTVSSSTMIASLEAPPEDYASAQGILAQMRILGGSLGIAASTAILHKDMSGGASLHVARRGGAGRGAASEEDRVRVMYAEAFRTDMVVATVISGFAVLFTVVALQQRRGRARRLREEDQRASTKS
ncbi:hypothetical protein EsDP_00004001 [Epichloe bromicola]|uniref:Major facilitator superfamily (MFS) profile domain-containing protein n=1 Tax=Epichloe bromicola TaxID=79588 RepID=A0ABQ0CQF2_9HYPO